MFMLSKINSILILSHDAILILLCFLWSFSLFLIGLFGICWNRRNLILLLISVEIMMLGVNLIFIFTSVLFSVHEGQVFALISLSLSAAEAAVGFGLIIALFRHKQNITFEASNKLHG